MSKDAQAGDNVTISPSLAISLALSTASSKVFTLTVGTSIPFSFCTLSKASFITSLVAPNKINSFIYGYPSSARGSNGICLSYPPAINITLVLNANKPAKVLVGLVAIESL